MKPLIRIAILGNVLYFLWILSNGLDEGFKGTTGQVVSYAGILVLLALNSVLLYRNKDVKRV